MTVSNAYHTPVLREEGERQRHLTGFGQWRLFAGMAKRRDQNETESRRIIERVQQESETGILGRTARRFENHIGAKDADQSDWAEVWGTRIGRTLGAIAVVTAFIWLVQYLLAPT